MVVAECTCAMTEATMRRCPIHGDQHRAPTEREAGDVGEVEEVILAALTRNWHGDDGYNAKGHGPADDCAMCGESAEVLAPLIAARERAAGARALREAADLLAPFGGAAGQICDWLRERAATYTEGGER